MLCEARAELTIDLYTEAAIPDPHPLYRAIRDLAPVVWLSTHEVFALSRYDDVQAALRNDQALISGRGVALNDTVKELPTRPSRATADSIASGAAY